MKSFTVIIPTYNSEKWIESCVNSLLNQDYDQDKIQILVVDDGSKDNIAEVMKQYQNNKAVQYIKKPNGQWGSVINYVRNNKIAKNDIISILDADDMLTPNAFKTINANIKDADLFVGSYRKWDGHKKRAWVHPYWFIWTRTIKNKQKMNSPFCLPLIYFVKKEVFYKTHDLMEGVAYQDPDYISQLIMHSNKLRFTWKSIGLYYYNRAGNSISQKWDDKRFAPEYNACARCIKNNAQEIVSYRLNLKQFRALCSQKGVKFKINRKMSFKWYPFYIRWIYVIMHNVKFKKYFRLEVK